MLSATRFLLSSSIILVLCSSASATGHLRLELTASADCALRLTTEHTSETVSLFMAEKRITSFHLRNGQDSLKIFVSVNGSEPKEHTYHLKVAQDVHFFAFSKVVLSVEWFFECDAGFFGPQCLDTLKPTTSTSTTTSSSTSSSTSTSTSTSTTTSTTTTTTMTTSATALPSNQSAPAARSVPTDILIVLLLAIILISLLVLLVLLALPRRQRVYLEPEIFEPETKKKLTEDSGFGSPDNTRYTAAPYTSQC
ncbi:unnamed protein product [Caenorhabditis sp. 36 PRJEB53466]|nr:unnamed protein product [Caenorhabditis sp. 36 PRJEB53466]